MSWLLPQENHQDPRLHNYSIDVAYGFLFNLEGRESLNVFSRGQFVKLVHENCIEGLLAVVISLLM